MVNHTSMLVNKCLLIVIMATEYGRVVFSFDDGMLKVTIPLAFERQRWQFEKELRNRCLL